MAAERSARARIEGVGVGYPRGGKKAKSGVCRAPLLHRGLDFRRTVRAKMLASDRATRRYRDPIAGPIAKVSSRRSRRVGSRDRTRSDPRGAVEIRWRAVSDQTAFRFPVSPGGFSKQMSASSSVKSGSGAYLGPRSAVYRLLQAQHKVRELLRPLLRLGRLTLLEQTQSEGESRGGTGSRSARARLGTGGGRDREKSNRGEQSGALNRLVFAARGVGPERRVLTCAE